MNHESQELKDALARLLGEAGLRPEVEALPRARVERAVRAAWQAGLQRRRRRQWSLALAASISIASIAMVWQFMPRPAPVIDLAVVMHVEGQVTVANEDGVRAVNAGDRVNAGMRIDTGDDGRIALSLDHLDSLRIDRSTRLTLIDRSDLNLAFGAVYIDSGDGEGGVSVTTPLLTARDIGTRFMVRHHEPAGIGAAGIGAAGSVVVGSDVAVRDGQVQVDDGIRSLLDPGERLRLAPDGSRQRTRLPAHDASWQWARAVTLPFDVRERPLRELLQWYAHDAGLRLEIAPDAALQARLDASLQGDLHGLTPDELLQVAAAAVPFTLHIDRENGRLHVMP